MKRFISIMCIALTMLLTACAGTSGRVQTAYVPAKGEKFNLQLTAPVDTNAEGVQILRERLNLTLAQYQRLATPADAAARKVEVDVKNYYFRHGAVRALVGIFAGVDNIQSSVTVKDTATGKVLAQFMVESKNPTAWGTSRGLLEQHADQIAYMLEGTKL